MFSDLVKGPCEAGIARLIVCEEPRSLNLVFVHDEGNGAAQAGFVAVLCGAQFGNTNHRNAAHLLFNPWAGEAPDSGDVAHHDDFRRSESGSDHVHAAAEGGTHAFDGLARGWVADAGQVEKAIERGRWLARDLCVVAHAGSV